MSNLDHDAAYEYQFKISEELEQDLRSKHKENLETMFEKSRARPRLTKSVCDLLNLTKKIEQNVRVFDTVGNLQLIHYTSPDHRSIYPYRGIVVDTKNRKIVCRSIPFVPEIDILQADESEINMLNDVKKFEVYEIFRGTYLRLFWNSSKKSWTLSSHRKIDASDARWGGSKFWRLI